MRQNLEIVTPPSTPAAPSRRGIYQEPERVYREVDALCASDLEHLLVSPAYYLYRLAMGSLVPPTEAQAFGTAGHCYWLEPDQWKERFAVAPKVNRSTKEGKAEWAAFVAESAGRQVVDHDDFEQIKLCAWALEAQAAVLKRDAQIEVSIYGEKRGSATKCRPDILKGRVITDLKFVHDASPEEFQRSVYNFGWYRRAPWYMDIATQVTGELVDTYQFLLVEKKKAPRVFLYELDGDTIARGRFENEKAFEIFDTCKRTSTWQLHARRATLPGWAR